MKKITASAVCAAAAVCVFSAQPAFATAGVIIAPSSAVINSGGPGFGSINDTINQNGLSAGYTSGVTNFNSYIATNPTHTDIFAGNEWFSNSGTTSASVTYDLGSLLGIDALALWNEETSGIGHLNLFGSTDGTVFTQFASLNPFDNPLADYPAEVFTFSPTAWKFVRFDMSGCPQPNPGGFPSCAIGEVAFRTADLRDGGVPEPSTWAMMLLGFGMAGFGLRNRRKPTVRVTYA